ncbi:mechanosensitive ion channel family protein [Mucilaginibacter myungsuensis]|uniref:Mechanosensitive ion channel family protein n=1 Tax=Mucilaginibacter myungsuensis TaxID=649104 RepID=A0A929KXS9_9SPHI|nr:mechanosensitive ion channel family protein [Mucilaginibacter myungsuensis]MBE9663624.1 mechanosensitive ion channel family protein [Mucilaginibacter myungsuensis]MDN3599052.1 mechanosensitive ion channel family protein [Mucilaginibacter myungsuensis]
MKKKFDINEVYEALYNWMINYGVRAVIGIIVLIVGFWLIKLIINRSKTSLRDKNVDPSVKPFLMSLLGVALRVLLIIGVIQIMGIELTLFTAVVGAFGVAAGLALSGTLQNFASGLMILLLKPFSVGDNIISQGLEGTVTSIEIFYTIVTTFDNRTVIVPNSKLSNEVIINISREGIRRLDLNMKFPNGADIRQAKDVLDRAISKCTNVLAKPQRRVGVGELQNDGFLMSINVWVNAHGYQDTKLAVQETLLQDVKDAGIKIAGL